jgi:hypothetical protein
VPPAPADVGGALTVSSFNVLNYFLIIDEGEDICVPEKNVECRGADTAQDSEAARQDRRGLDAIDADVFGLIEMENTEDAGGGPVKITIDAIFQDEAVDACGSGHTAPDGRVSAATQRRSGWSGSRAATAASTTSPSPDWRRRQLLRHRAGRRAGAARSDHRRRPAVRLHREAVGRSSVRRSGATAGRGTGAAGRRIRIRHQVIVFFNSVISAGVSALPIRSRSSAIS